MSEIDINVVVSAQPTTGVSRHIGGVYAAKDIRDDRAIAAALREIADKLDAQAPKKP